jgi:hypothetical protein
MPTHHHSLPLDCTIIIIVIIMIVCILNRSMSISISISTGPSASIVTVFFLHVIISILYIFIQRHWFIDPRRLGVMVASTLIFGQ